METCKFFNVLPEGLKTANVPFISFVRDYIKISWHNAAKSKEKYQLETLILGIKDKKNWFEGEILGCINGHI